MTNRLPAAAERGAQLMLLVLLMAIVPGSATASGGEATPPSLTTWVGDWLAPGNNVGADQELRMGILSIRMSIQPDGNFSMTTKSKRDGQQQFDTSKGRIDGHRLLFDNGHSATIRQSGSMLEVIDSSLAGKTILFQRQQL